MSVPEPFVKLSGTWKGSNRVWLNPSAPVMESETGAAVSVIAQGRFFKMQYHWSVEGEAADGLLVLGFPPDPAEVDAFWLDSWHMGDKFMRLRGAAGPGGVVSVLGSYAAPNGPDWGWRIEVIPDEADGFILRMHNILPDGISALAVEAAYERHM